MKVSYTTTNNRIQVEFEAPNEKEVFKVLNRIQEVFDESKCGNCGENDLMFCVRNVDDNDYFELKCRKCFHKLAFGQHKKGNTLFPKRFDDEGKFVGKNGWFKWVPEDNKEDAKKGKK